MAYIKNGCIISLKKRNILFIFGFTLLFTSCLQKEQIEKYNKTVTKADCIKLYSINNNTLTLDKIITDKIQLDLLKSILKNNIEIKKEKKIVPNFKIEIYQENKLQGVLLIEDKQELSYANFQNQEFCFGFQLTYALGMYLNDL